MASAQAQTHFLDSARLQDNLSISDFSFEDLKTKPTTIYFVLPTDRLSTFGRWLRLLVQQAITINARNIDVHLPVCPSDRWLTRSALPQRGIHGFDAMMSLLCV